jgi:hypothetical protein
MTAVPRGAKVELTSVLEAIERGDRDTAHELLVLAEWQALLNGRRHAGELAAARAHLVRDENPAALVLLRRLIGARNA